MGQQLSIPPVTAGVAVAAAAVGAYVMLKPKKKEVGACCPGQSEGFLPQDVNYKPQGAMVKIDGASAYVAGREGDKAVVLCHDVFGLHTGRHKQIADEIASRGFLVVIPDFFEEQDGGLWGDTEKGYVAGPSFSGPFLTMVWQILSGNMTKYFKLHPWDPLCGALWTKKIAPWLKGKGCTSVGVIGVCWGAYASTHIAALAPHAAGLPVAANVVYHPSFDTVAALFGEDQEVTVKAAGRVPTSVYSTAMESKAWKPGGQAQKWMREANPDGVASWHPVEKHMHGFVTRGDMKADPAIGEDIQRILEDSIKFLQQHMA
eukprot:g4831.t1